MADSAHSDEKLDEDLEKKGDYQQEVYAVTADASFKYDSSQDRLQRRLKQRHVQMIGIAGTIGTGLFLGTGRALSEGGPVGALIAYAFVGTVAYASLCAVGEMTCFAPISGTFPHYAARWVDPAFGFAIGWNFFYAAVVGIPVEIVAAQLLTTYWDKDLSHAPIYIGVVCVALVSINLFGVRFFGESEFVFSLIKIAMVIGLIITGLVIDLGGAPDHKRRGFQYWKNPGPFHGIGLEPTRPHLDQFLGVVGVLVQAAYSYQGMEMVVVAGSETQSPRRNIGKAVRRVFWRILIFYMLSVFVVTLIVPSNDRLLLRATGNAAESPYVIAMTTAGIKVLPSIINAGILTSAFSAASSGLFCGSRVLYGLSLRGQAPKFLMYCTSSGLPLAALIATSLPVCLSFMTVSAGGATVFNWFVSLSTVSGFMGWAAVNLTYIRFYRGLRHQGIDRSKFIYTSPFQPYLSYWGLFWTVIFILINGFYIFWEFNASDFLTCYINIPFFVILYVGYKVFKKTKIWSVDKMDFVTGIPSIEETETPPVVPTTAWGKILEKLF
ncbi:general amino acid permease 1 [Athelia psychrophila]|uniref:General amino acid permease 1 n=1 Tax=Athelia psychrophila TaxID=1759441 RepID=A0A167VFG9_9AGAM|nr:general amino acid permease 1 [Fibularhizoctonia sp. CBS 109695]